MTGKHNGNETSRRSLLGGAVAVGAAAAAGLAAGPAWAQESASAGRFASRSVLITGASSGIGEATAGAFVREGARVAFDGRRAELGAEVERSITADPATQSEGGEALYVQSDVRDEEQIIRFARTARVAFGAPHVAFNNACVVFDNGSLTGNAPLADIAAMDFDDVWATNTRGFFPA